MTKQRKSKGRRIWVIRAGKQGEAHDLFVEKNLVALSDSWLGDLRLFPKERSAFYGAYGSRHAEDGPVAIRGKGGKYFRFIHEVQKGDLVLYPCLRDKKVYVGKVAGSYFFDNSVGSKFPHRRNISWCASVPKKVLSEGAQRELGAARTFFRFKSHTDEIDGMDSV